MNKAEQLFSPITVEDELGRVLVEIAEALGARGAMLTLHPGGGDAGVLVHLADAALDGDAVRTFVAHGRIDDERLAAGFHVWHSDSMLPGVRWMMSVPVQRVAGHARLVITAFFEEASAAVQAQADAIYLRRRPFAVGYFRLWQQERIAATVNRSLDTALELLDICVLLVGERGELLHANHAGKDLLGLENGLRLWRGRLQPTVLAEASRFDVLLSHVLARRDPHDREKLPLLRLSRVGREPLIVSIHRDPAPRRDDEGASAVVFVVEPDVDVVGLVAPVCRMFGLSPVEARLVGLLAGGKTIAEAAVLLHVREASARSYLKPIFAKTGTHRQSDLIRLVMMSAVRVGASVSARPERSTEARWRFAEQRT